MGAQERPQHLKNLALHQIPLCLINSVFQMGFRQIYACKTMNILICLMAESLIMTMQVTMVLIS